MVVVTAFLVPCPLTFASFQSIYQFCLCSCHGMPGTCSRVPWLPRLSTYPLLDTLALANTLKMQAHKYVSLYVDNAQYFSAVDSVHPIDQFWGQRAFISFRYLILSQILISSRVWIRDITLRMDRGNCLLWFKKIRNNQVNKKHRDYWRCWSSVHCSSHRDLRLI